MPHSKQSLASEEYPQHPHFNDDINAAEITLRILLQMSTYLIWTAECVDNPSTENNMLLTVVWSVYRSRRV